MQKLPSNKTYFYNVFTGWDTTPRYKENASIVLGSNPSSFKNHFGKMLALSRKTSSDFIFVRAWNEWGQCMVLEPSQEFGFGYLEAIKESMQNEY